MNIYIVCYQPSLKRPPLKDGFRTFYDAKLFVEGLPNNEGLQVWDKDEEDDWNYGVYYVRQISV
jgi:hypothetical protein